MPLQRLQSLLNSFRLTHLDLSENMKTKAPGARVAPGGQGLCLSRLRTQKEHPKTFLKVRRTWDYQLRVNFSWPSQASSPSAVA